jgi:hypothetical protein
VSSQNLEYHCFFRDLNLYILVMKHRLRILKFLVAFILVFPMVSTSTGVADIFSILDKSYSYTPDPAFQLSVEVSVNHQNFSKMKLGGYSPIDEKSVYTGDKFNSQVKFEPNFPIRCKYDLQLSFQIDGKTTKVEPLILEGDDTDHHPMDGQVFQVFSSNVVYFSQNIGFDLLKSGQFSFQLTGLISCTTRDNGTQEFNISETEDPFMVLKSSLPKPISVSSVSCPKGIKFSLTDDRTYICQATVRDGDHVATKLNHGLTDVDRFKNAKAWKRTKSGWIISFPIKFGMVTPAELDNFHRVEAYPESVWVYTGLSNLKAAGFTHEPTNRYGGPVSFSFLVRITK